MNGYIAFFKGMKWECYAPTRADAYRMALDYFKPVRKKRHLVTVVLSEKDGKIVTRLTPSGN